MSSPHESKTFFLNRYPFSQDTVNLLTRDVWLKNYWPIIYILSSASSKRAYVGESTIAIKRLQAHLAHPQKQQCLHIRQ